MCVACLLTRSSFATVTSVSASRGVNNNCVIYFPSYPYAESGGVSDSTSAVTGAFGRTYTISDVPSVPNCSASTTVSSDLSTGHFTMDANGGAVGPNMWGVVSANAYNSVSFNYVFEVSLPAKARIVYGAPAPQQKAGITLGRDGATTSIFEGGAQATDTVVSLDPGRYVLNGGVYQNTSSFYTYTSTPDTVTSTFNEHFELRVTENPPPCPTPWYSLSTTGGANNLLLQDASNFDERSMADMANNFRQLAVRNSNLSTLAALVPGGAVDSVSAAMRDLAFNLAIIKASDEGKAALEVLDPVISLVRGEVGGPIADTYLKATSHLLAATSAIFRIQADQLSDPSYAATDYGCFSASSLNLFGDQESQYGPLSDALAEWRASLDDLSTAGQALSRARGALAAGDSAGFEAQRGVFVAVLTSADQRFLAAASSLSQARSLFSSQGVSDSPADSTLLQRVRDYVVANGLPPDLQGDLAKLGLSASQIQEIVAALAGMDVNAPQPVESTYALIDSVVTELGQDTTRAQLTPPATSTAVPASNAASLAALAAALMALGAMRRPSRPSA
jgi:hypothetical protein